MIKVKTELTFRPREDVMKKIFFASLVYSIARERENEFLSHSFSYFSPFLLVTLGRARIVL